MLPKIREAHRRIEESGQEIRLQVDGGVNEQNIRMIKDQGADTFVSGSTIFSSANELDPNNYDSIIRLLRSLLKDED